MRLLVLAVLVVSACRDKPRSAVDPPTQPPVAERSAPTRSDLPAIDRPTPVPRPPGSPDRDEYKPPTPMAAPAEVVTFLKAHASGARPWQVTVYELDGAGDDFGGYRVASTNTADSRLADQLIERLAADRSYASYDCHVPPVGVRIERDGAVLGFVADCRVRIDGMRDVAGFSPEMLVFMRDLEAATVPCKWVRLDYFDLEACVEKFMRYAGGSNPTLLAGTACPQLVIGAWQRPDEKDTRRVGTVEVSCSPRDEAACAAVCDSLRPTPNSTATASFPEGGPVIRSTTQGGIAGTEQTISIWRDGTVVFSGTSCRKLRGARARLDPRQVESLLARLADQRGAEASRELCMDCFVTRVFLLDDHELVEVHGEAGALVSAAVGPNPC